jgi:hypothetical protein
MIILLTREDQVKASNKMIKLFISVSSKIKAFIITIHHLMIKYKLLNFRKRIKRNLILGKINK